MATGGYLHAGDLPQVIPVFPLDGVLLLPRGQLPLNIFEPRYLNMIDDAMAGDRLIGMVQTQNAPPGETSDPARPRLAQIGCAGRITSYAETGDGRYLITLTGIQRFAIAEELAGRRGYRRVRADFSGFPTDLDLTPEASGVERCTNRRISLPFMRKVTTVDLF